MLAPGELLRAAGNVFVVPAPLATHAEASSWRRGLLVGSADATTCETVAQELRAIAPDLTLDVFVRQPQSLGQVRRRRYDVVVLALTGEGRRGEKLLGLRARAGTVVARGTSGEWYRVELPQWHPASPRAWGRVLFVLLPLLLLYLLVMEFVLLSDVIVGWFRRAPTRADPGLVADTQVSFVVPTYNQRELMDFCLPALLEEAGERHTVIVVDDAGTDDTTEYVRRTYPRVQVIRLERNLGFAGAVRAGIAASTTPLFALINNDAQVRPGFLEWILPHFAQQDVFAVCAHIELPEGSPVETGRVVASFSGILEPHHLPPTEKPAPILYAGGASSVFHRARYEALGGLDTLYHPFYWEDIELGYRAWRVGWRSVFEPRASVLHRRRATIGPRFGDDYANQTFLKNALLFVLKNVRDRRLLSQHFAYVCARLVKELPGGDRMMSGAVRRALPLLTRVVRRRWQARRRGDLTDGEVMALLEPLHTPMPEGAGP
jgi:GT2 family glycosyltransferase